MVLLNIPRWLAPLLIILLIAGSVLANRWLKPQEQDEFMLNCPDLGSGCRFNIDGRGYELGMAGEVKLMAPFELWLKAPGSTIAEASFTMDGMDMGFNLYTLKPGPDGTLRTQVTLPVCVTGRRDWDVHLQIEKRRFRVSFVTEP